MSKTGCRNEEGMNAKTHDLLLRALIMGTDIMRQVLGRALNTVY